MQATAKDVLAGIRRKYPKTAVVREVVITDPFQQAIFNRWRITRRGPAAVRWAAHCAELGLPIADEIPEGWHPTTAKFDRRIDALLLAGGQSTAIEIKISVADFRRDNDEKRSAWRSATNRFVYATPPGLLTVDMVPPGCGLWEVYSDARSKSSSVVVVKKAVVNKMAPPLPAQVVTAMFYRVSNYERAAGLTRSE